MAGLSPLKQMWLFLIVGLIIQFFGIFLAGGNAYVPVVGAVLSIIGLSYAFKKASFYTFIDLLIYGLITLAVAIATAIKWWNIILAIPSFSTAAMACYISVSSKLEGKPITTTFNPKEQILYLFTRFQLYKLAKQNDITPVSMKWKKEKIVKTLSNKLNLKDIELQALTLNISEEERKKIKGAQITPTLGGALLTLSGYITLVTIYSLIPMAFLGGAMLIEGLMARKGLIRSI
ncbi:MAG: hypothetical protein Q6352_011320 [Candidatus Freyrarchaeum guaymaensis]|nr:hypothetical protein [Candidatus Sigynarchaeota archaeon]